MVDDGGNLVDPYQGAVHLEEEESEKVLAEQMIQEMIGVAKVVRHISQSGKPIVGHNCLLGRSRIFFFNSSEFTPIIF